MQSSEILTGMENDMKYVGIVPEGPIKRNSTSYTTSTKTQKKKKTGYVTINCLDYSTALDIIAFGTVHGQVCVLDSSTMSFVG